MKKFSFKRILSLFLAVVMLVGLSNVSANAAEDSTTNPISIRKNVYYDEKLNIMFAVDTGDVDVASVDFSVVKDSAKVGLNSIDDPTFEYVYVVKEGVALQNIGDVYVATATVTDSDGNIYEKTCSYSVLEYYYERLFVSTGVSDKQIDMYEKMVAAAEAVELVMDGTTTIADSVYIHVTDGTVDGVNAGGVYNAGDVITGLTTDIEVADGYELYWEIIAYDKNGKQTDGYVNDTASNIEEYTVPNAKYVIATPSVKESGYLEPQWTLVTDVSQITAGAQIVIVANGYNYALSTTQNGNNRGQAAVTKNATDNTVTFGDGVQIITVEAGKVSGTFAFNVGTGYLYAASSGSNYLRTEKTLSNNSSWTISIDSKGVATIKAQGSYTRNVMQYNQSSSLFSCYGSASQKAISIYILK